MAENLDYLKDVFGVELSEEAQADPDKAKDVNNATGDSNDNVNDTGNADNPADDVPKKNDEPGQEKDGFDVKAINDDPAKSDELSDEDIVKLIKARKGIELKSLDDLVKPTDKKIAQEKRDTAKLKYAFESGIITKREYDSYNQDAANLNRLVFEDYKADMLSGDPDLTEDEIRDSYNEEFHINEDEDSAAYKRGQKKIERIGQQLLKDKHNRYFSIDSAFDRHEQSINEERAKQKKIAENTVLYKNNVDEAAKSMQKMTIRISEKESYQITIPDKELDEIKDIYGSKNVLEKNILNAVSKEEIAESMRMAFLSKNLNKIIKSVASKMLMDNAKGAAGIPTNTNIANRKTSSQNKMSEKAKQALREMGLLSEN